MSDREAGFYWVTRRGDMIVPMTYVIDASGSHPAPDPTRPPYRDESVDFDGVAQWDGSGWFIPGDEFSYDDSHFVEIDERRLERPA